MSEKKPLIKRSVGFVACYKGNEVAFSTSFKELANTAKVKALLGNKNLVIKHNVPENLIAIY